MYAGAAAFAAIVVTVPVVGAAPVGEVGPLEEVGPLPGFLPFVGRDFLVPVDGLPEVVVLDAPVGAPADWVVDGPVDVAADCVVALVTGSLVALPACGSLFADVEECAPLPVFVPAPVLAAATVWPAAVVTCVEVEPVFVLLEPPHADSPIAAESASARTRRALPERAPRET